MTDHATASLVQANLTLPSTLTQIGISLVMLLALWPTRRRAAALLSRWGLREPTELDTDAGLTYLKRRRLAYPGLYLALTLGTSPWLPTPALVLAVLLAGGLLAGAIDWQRGRAAAPANTSATPPSGIWPRARALVPWWSFTLGGMLVGAVVLPSGAALLGQAWALRMIPEPGAALWVLWVAAAAVLASAAVIWLAVHRPTHRSARADATLRMRSARVGVGLGLLALAAIALYGGSAVGAAVAALGVAGALATTAPVRSRFPAAVERSDMSRPERCA